MSRAGRIAKTLAIGYGFQFVNLLVGLSLIPFFFHRLGQELYGEWLVINQILMYLALLDFGVTAILPRDLAIASGSPENRQEKLKAVISASWVLVLRQLPIVAAIVLVTWGLVSHWEPHLSGPLAVVSLGFLVLFPMRVAGAILNGLLDLTFLGWIQVLQWLILTSMNVGLLLAGGGLYALTVGWITSQLVTALLCFYRFRRKHPELIDAFWQRPSQEAIRERINPSLWASVRQLSQILLNGTEVIILRIVLGPAAVVVYNSTARLSITLYPIPYGIAMTSWTTISELRGTGQMDRLWNACQAVGLSVLLLSGAIVISLLPINELFVTRWIGADQFGGQLLSIVIPLVMITRHFVFTSCLTVLAWGNHDRRSTLAGIADGIVTVLATYFCVQWLGLLGAPLGSLIGVALTNGPAAIGTLAKELHASIWQTLRWSFPWFSRFVCLLLPMLGFCFFGPTTDYLPAFTASLLGITSYALCMYPLLFRDPLRNYATRLTGFLNRKS